MAKGFDVVVIGGGPVGICGANTAGIFGRRVALIEKLPEVGGAGINTGTIPSKTLRETALALSGLRSRKLFGVDLSLRREATVADFTRHQQNVAAHERRHREEQMRTFNVETFHGAASFVDSKTVRVSPDTLLRGEKILIATGSSPLRPAEFPFEHPRVHDSDEILEIGVLPKTLAVVGAGVVGAVYACTFAALGALRIGKTETKTSQMKTRRQWIGSVVAVALFGAFVSIGASWAHAQATKKGWWIRVNGPKTEASTISFQIGTSKQDSRNWRTWKSGQRVEFDVPTDFRDVAQLYLRATSNPHDKNAWFCVFYKDHGVEHFEFDGDEDHKMKQDDSDDDCKP